MVSHEEKQNYYLYTSIIINKKRPTVKEFWKL